MAKAGKLVVDLEMNEAKFAAAVRNAEKEASRLNKRLEAQSETFGQTARAAKIYALEQKGATAETIAQSKALDALIVDQEELARMQTRAAGLFQQTRTPAEKYKQTLGELDGLLAKGAISTEVYGRAQKQAQTAMKGTSLIARQAGEDIKAMIHKLGPILLAYKAFQGIKEAFKNSDDAGVQSANAALQRAEESLNQMFEKIAIAIAPAVESLAEVFIVIADTVGAVLIPVLEVAAAIVAGIVDGLKAAVDWIGDINIGDAINEYNAANDRAAKLDQIGPGKAAKKYSEPASDEEAARRMAEEQARLEAIRQQPANDAASKAQRAEIAGSVVGGLLEFGAAFEQVAEAAARHAEEMKKAEAAQKKLMAEGNQLELSLRTPWEAAADELARYTELLEKGAIDQETFNRAQAKIEAGLKTEANAAIDRLALPAALSAGSSDAISAVNQFQQQNRITTVAEQQRDILKEIRELMRRRNAEQPLEVVF